MRSISQRISEIMASPGQRFSPATIYLNNHNHLKRKRTKKREEKEREKYIINGI